MREAQAIIHKSSLRVPSLLLYHFFVSKSFCCSSCESLLSASFIRPSNTVVTYPEFVLARPQVQGFLKNHLQDANTFNVFLLANGDV